jgi:hypothetical protein
LGKQGLNLACKCIAGCKLITAGKSRKKPKISLLPWSPAAAGSLTACHCQCASVVVHSHRDRRRGDRGMDPIGRTNMDGRHSGISMDALQLPFRWSVKFFYILLADGVRWPFYRDCRKNIRSQELGQSESPRLCLLPKFSLKFYYTQKEDFPLY